MRKQALLALMLALTLILTGCTLVQKDPAVDAATEIVRLGDKVVTKGEIQEQVNEELEYMSYLYSMYGYNFDATSATAIADAQKSVLDDVKKDLVKEAKIKELGLDQMTEEEEAEIKSEAESVYQSNLDYILSSNYADSELSDEEKTEAAKAELEKTGYNMDKAIENARESKLEEKLREEIIKDVTVSDEEIQAEYDERVATAKSAYENSAGTWAAAANNGTTLYYTPAGVRYVKQILVKFLADDQSSIDAANQKVTDANAQVTAADAKIDAAQQILDQEGVSEEDATAAKGDLEKAQAELETAQASLEAAQKELSEAREKAFANLDETADGILADLENGADWDTLMAEKNEDPGMKSGVTAERGYAVAADMTSFDPAFVSAAMGLEKIGDVSAKTRGDSYGYYIIKYVGDAVEGPIDLAEVKDSLQETVLSNKQDTTYDNQIQEWVDAADFKVDEKALNN